MNDLKVTNVNSWDFLTIGSQQLSDAKDNCYDRRRIFQKIETSFLDSCSYIPGLSILTEAIRLVYSKALMILALGEWIYHQGASFMLDDIEGRHKYLAAEAIYIAGHSLANVGRAMVTFIPLIGNIACFLYDKMGYKINYILDDKTTLTNSWNGSLLVDKTNKYN